MPRPLPILVLALTLDASLAAQEPPAPSAVVDLAAAAGAVPALVCDEADAIGYSTIVLLWTAPSAGGGSAGAYELRYSRSAPIVSEGDFDLALPVAGLPLPAPAGEAEWIDVGSLEGEGRYHFALKSRVDGGPWSALSNPAEGGVALFRCEAPDELPCEAHMAARHPGSPFAILLLAAVLVAVRGLYLS